jgi:hypothetical protein
MNLGVQQLADALPSLMDDLAPMFVVDHVAAASSWLVFYLIEALAIVAVLDRYPNDKDSAVRVSITSFTRVTIAIPLTRCPCCRSHRTRQSRS